MVSLPGSSRAKHREAGFRRSRATRDGRPKVGPSGWHREAGLRRSRATRDGRPKVGPSGWHAGGSWGVVPPRANQGGGGRASLAVGIIGAGWMGKEHRRVLGSLDGVSLAAVCDVDRERAEDLARGTGARVYLDWRDLLDREDLAALIVAVPPLSHREPAVAALTRGLPLDLEKPIAPTPADAPAIAEAAERTGTVCAVGYQWHALDLLDDLRDLLQDEQIGLLVGTSIGPTQSRPWFLNR